QNGSDHVRLGLGIGHLVSGYGDVCQVIATLAIEHETAIAVADFRTLNLCVDEAIAAAARAHGRDREQLVVQKAAVDLGQLADSLQGALSAAMTANRLLQSGTVGTRASTARVLDRSLQTLCDLVDSSSLVGRNEVRRRSPTGEIGGELATARSLLETARAQTHAAQMANKELEAFSYSVSHDLRAPLRAIDGFSRALLADCSDELPEHGKDYLRRVRAATQRMAELIEDLMRLAKLDHVEFRREPVDLSKIVAGQVGRLREAEPARAVVAIVEDALTATTDPRLIRIVLDNLVTNAWKFSAKVASPVIEFGATEEAGELVYFVRDNGVGFDMTRAGRLFDAFHRLHAGSEFDGHGIGLASARRVVTRHGGRIWADAAVGKGATFHFTLP
ncbi:MAG: ATP-binding protein, partial [Kofleriaceae bacterium]